MLKIPITNIIYKDHAIDILRLDETNIPVAGNKFYKLKYNVEEARKGGFTTILTFGGAFSNHIYAVAKSAKQNNINTIGVIRGEEDPDNPMLQIAKELGMELVFISREQYKNKANSNFIAELKNKFGNFYLLPEGGTNELAIKGCAEILKGLENKYDHIFSAIGTGGTIAGLLSTPGLKSKVTGISVLKGDDNLTEKIKTLISGQEDEISNNWSIDFNYHLGGYARFNQNLINFIRQFKIDYQIPLDPVYTGKVLYAVFDLIEKGKLISTEKILVIHTGGLHGIKGWNYRFGKL